MAVNTTWSDPATASGSGGLDMATGATLTETIIDRYASDLYRLGGTDGNAKTGKYQIGSATSFSNAGMTQGLTINQDGNDDEILSLKSSDVAHGMTTVTETDTYGRFLKYNAAGGGLRIDGLDDGGGGTNGALFLNAALGQAADTTHTAAGYGVVRVQASVKNGTGVTTVGANGNLFSIDNASGTRFIVDAEGNYFSDDTGSTYDGWDDLALVETFDLRRDFAQWRDARKDLLVRAGILAPDDAQGNRGFVNWTNLLRLHNGALCQVAARLARLEYLALPAGGAS